MAGKKTRRETETKASNKKAKAQSQSAGGKFKVLRGLHNEGGRTYRRGEVVDSEIDLVARFGKHKFRRVGDSPNGNSELQRTTAASEAAAHKHPLKGHDRPISAMVDDDDEEDYDEEMDDDEEDLDDEEMDETEEDETEEEEESAAEDVTSSFKKEAKAAGATVEKEGNVYRVYSKDGELMGRKTGYTRKDEVLKVLKKNSK